MSLLQTQARRAPVLVLAVGNPSRGDDALGPLLAERLQAWLGQQDAATLEAIEVITDQQLVVEHVFDMQGRSHVLFVDAAAQGDQPVSLAALQAPVPWPDQQAAHLAAEGPLQPIDSHRSTPAQLLALHQHLLNAAPPASSLLTITGHGFELGEPLSVPAQAALEQAWAALLEWLGRRFSP